MGVRGSAEFAEFAEFRTGHGSDDRVDTCNKPDPIDARLLAKKLQSSLAVEGELPEHGLAASGDDGDDLMLARARKIVAGKEDADSAESVFAQAQQVVADAGALLVDEEWAAPGPVPVEAVGVHHSGQPRTGVRSLVTPPAGMGIV